MPPTIIPEPLPRDDVRQIYDTIANSPVLLTLSEVIARCPAYKPGQVYWACGTLTRQRIIEPCGAVRSDGKSSDHHFDVKLPFEPNYVGWEDAK